MQDDGNYSESAPGLTESATRAWGMERKIRKRAGRPSVANCFHLSNSFCSWHLMEVQRVTIAFPQTVTRGFNIHSDQAAVWIPLGIPAKCRQKMCAGENPWWDQKNMLGGHNCSVHQTTLTMLAQESTDTVEAPFIEWGWSEGAREARGDEKCTSGNGAKIAE